MHDRKKGMVFIMKKTRIAIIGTGGIAGAHMVGYKALTDTVEVVAGCDLDEEKLNRFCDTHGIPGRYTDYNEMLAKEDIDAVSVTTWNAAHKGATIAALKAGCDVICEKPMAMNTAEALEMEKTAKETGRLLQIGFVRRYGGDTLSAKDYIDSGKMGELKLARVGYERRNGCPGGWFGDIRYSGGGPLTDLGVHVMDLARYLAGRPTPVSAYGIIGYNADAQNVAASDWSVDTTGKFEHNCEDYAIGFIRFDNGFTIEVNTSFNLRLENRRNGVQLIGTKSGLELDNPSKFYTQEEDGTIDSEGYPTCDFNGLFTAEIAHFIDCVRNGTECIAPAHDGVVLMQMIDAIYESARTGKEVAIKPLD